MENKRALAIDNNLALYMAVFAAHGHQLQITNDIYYLEEQTPPMYSNIVTRTESWSPDNTFKKIDQNFEVQGWEEWSIKDSFQCLDLTSFGFRNLFDSAWLFLNWRNFLKQDTSLAIRFEVVANKEGLLEWIKIWGEGQELGQLIYNENLLNNSDIYFVIGYSESKERYVALINKSGEDTVGISNFSALTNSAAVWSQLVEFIYDSFGRVNIVGYEGKETLAQISSIGIESVGDLTVWLKKK